MYKDKKRSKDIFGKELSLAQLNIISLMMMSTAVHDSIENNGIIQWSIQGAEPTSVIANLLIQVCNYSFSIIKLIENGLGTPAHSCPELAFMISGQKKAAIIFAALLFVNY